MGIDHSGPDIAENAKAYDTEGYLTPPARANENSSEHLVHGKLTTHIFPCYLPKFHYSNSREIMFLKGISAQQLTEQKKQIRNTKI